MEIDLHGLELWEVLEEIVYKLEECKTRGIREITLIHGFHRGQVLKNYIQSEGFLLFYNHKKTKLDFSNKVVFFVSLLY